MAAYTCFWEGMMPKWMLRISFKYYGERWATHKPCYGLDTSLQTSLTRDILKSLADCSFFS